MSPKKPSYKDIMPVKKSKSAKKKTAKSKAGKKQKISLWARLFKLGLLTAIWGMIGIFLVAAWYFVTLPDVADIKLVSENAGVDIYDRDDRRIARFGQTRGEIVPVEQLPQYVKDAVIAIEDHRFYDHFGIDLIGVSRAMFANLRAGGFVQGGSTLTQQLAKNLFLEPDKTLGRKIQEAMFALWMESKLTKDEILTAYLNRVYFGSGAYGVTAAANRYYNKQPTELNLAEAAQLAAALKAPSRINPVANPKDSVERAKIVLQAMATHDLITEQQAEQASENLEKSTLSSIDPASDDIPHYYTDWVLDKTGDYTNRGADGLVVNTSFDPALYDIARSHFNHFFKTEAVQKNVGQAAVVIMEFDGTVRTLIGGQSYSVSQYNRAVQAKRQPGSAFKPVVYLTAMEKGYRPHTLIWDAEFDSTHTYRPVNYNGEYLGEVTFREALAKSLNTASVRLADDVGIGNVIRTAEELGFSTLIQPDLSSALGSSEVTLMDLTAAYASFANGGQAVYPHTINRLKDGDGQTLYERRDYARRPQLFSRRSIADLQYMLRAVVENGTGRAAYIDSTRHIGGKTGTSQNYQDAWFVGYADGYVIGVWMGNDDNTPMKGVTGGGPPARLWRAIMNDVLQTRPLTSQNTSRTKRRTQPGMFGRVLERWSGGDSRTAGGR